MEVDYKKKKNIQTFLDILLMSIKTIINYVYTVGIF